MSFSKCFKKKKRFLSHQSQSLFESKIGTFSFTMWLSVKPLFFVNTKVFSQYKIIYISRRYSRENINWHGKKKAGSDADDWSPYVSFSTLDIKRLHKSEMVYKKH